MADQAANVPATESAKIAKIIDQYTLVINKGANHGVRVGQRFLVYAFGEEVVDPDNRQSLGRLELVKGTGKVTHVQPTMSTISSDMKSAPSRTIRRKQPSARIYWDFLRQGPEEVEEVLPAAALAFEEVEIGDLAKPV
ncbi:MAG: hypothetical protein ABSB82_15775 [Terriglobia bacterium]|jgi:hypothetical protein